MAAKTNPLNWNARIVNPDGTPTKEFMAKWAAQTRINAGIPALGLPAEVSAVLDVLSGTPNNVLIRGASQWEGHPVTDALDKVGSTRGDLLARKNAAWGRIASPSDTTKFLNGALDPVWGDVHDSDLSFSDIVTNNVSITKHGFVPKAPNDATKFLDGTGAFSVPASGGGGSSFFMPELTPGVASSVLAAGSFIALPFLAKSALVATGIEVWTTGGAGAALVSGLYEATAASGVYAASALKVQGASTIAVADKNLLPFSAPFTLTVGKWYWYGLVVVSGSISMPARPQTVPWAFSTQATAVLAAAPVAPSSTTALWTAWLY